MEHQRLTRSRVSAGHDGGEDGTNSVCHDNRDGVEAHDKAIIPHVQVLPIFWGQFYVDHPDAVTKGELLCRDLVNGPYFNGLAQYGVGRGNTIGTAKVNLGNPPATLSEDEAKSTVLGWLRGPLRGNAPAVNELASLYVIFMPPQTKPTISSGDDGFGGYHAATKLHDESRDDDVFFALIRTDKLNVADKSSGTLLIQAVSALTSHEIGEAVTDRDGRGYFNGKNGCEIGDLCEQIATHDYRGWQVELYWSQWDRACINGEGGISMKTFLRVQGITTGRLNDLHTETINVEYVASRFR